MKLSFVSIEIRHRLFGLCCYSTAEEDQVMLLKGSRGGGLDCVSMKGH